MVPRFQGSKVISKVSGHGHFETRFELIFLLKMMKIQGFEDVINYYRIGGR
jgi:hypothetical protein